MRHLDKIEASHGDVAGQVSFSELEERAPASLNIRLAKYQTCVELCRIYDGKEEASF
jgi:hypothetical protein